jgi:hypothetical protein
MRVAKRRDVASFSVLFVACLLDACFLGIERASNHRCSQTMGRVREDGASV